nr:G-type lectin S-receptor-like serine/threonine-protein kinase At4g27290 [Ipomoea batatas]
MGRVVFLTLFLSFLCNLGTSTDILRPGDVITPNTTLVSPNGNFALGFFRPGNSSSLFLGIWYNNLKDSVIWVANRESPLHDQDSHPRFTIGDDGNLRLLDGARNPKWSTNVSGPSGNYAAEAQLKDTGNFILKQGNSTVWESFDDGGDTLMPEMRLKGYSVYLSFAARDDEFYFSYTYRDASVPLRFFLSHDGYIQVLSKPENSEKWQNRLQFPDPSKCEMYGSCGSFGSCKKTGSNSVCSCLEGFKPKSEKNWENGNYSGGCVRRIGLECNENDKFMRFEWMKLPDHPVSLGNNNMTFTECEAQCYRNCSCSAFAYNNMSDIAKCLNWFGDLVDLAHKNSAALRDLHVRVHASELNGIGGIGNSAHKSIRPLQVAIMVSLVSAVSLVVISVLGYILKRRYYRKKGEKSIAIASQKSNALSPLGNGDVELLQLSLERILDATDNFNEANKLGEGGFGPVFKAWKNWKEGRPHEFVDPAIMRSSCDALKVIRCIEVGLLCVQAIPTDRPTMFDVVLMLSNPTLAIPPLKEPAFVTTNHSNAIVSMCYTKASDYYSKNEVTISDIIEPR